MCRCNHDGEVPTIVAAGLQVPQGAQARQVQQVIEIGYPNHFKCGSACLAWHSLRWDSFAPGHHCPTLQQRHFAAFWLLYS